MAFREVSGGTSSRPADVWPGVSDVNTWPDWNPDMKESQLDGPLQVGTTGTINTSGGKHAVVVTQFEPGKSFELESFARSSGSAATRTWWCGPARHRKDIFPGGARPNCW